jgi:hypothetical protein
VTTDRTSGLETNTGSVGTSTQAAAAIAAKARLLARTRHLCAEIYFPTRASAPLISSTPLSSPPLSSSAFRTATDASTAE